MDWKSFAYGVVAVFVVLLAMISIGAAHIGGLENSSGTNSGNMPEKCKVPAGQDESSWKEHLGHHADTQECLKYFE
jgi:hypothetical protein